MRAGKRVPEQHAIITWLIEHVAFLITARLRGVDGKTAYQMIRGRPFSKRLVEFGERVLFELPVKGPRHAERGELEARWSKGIVLGFSRFTNEYIVNDGEGIKRSRAIQRLTLEHRWHTESLERSTWIYSNSTLRMVPCPLRGRRCNLRVQRQSSSKQEPPKLWPSDKLIG